MYDIKHANTGTSWTTCEVIYQWLLHWGKTKGRKEENDEP